MADTNSRVETVIATGQGAQGQFGTGEEPNITAGPEAGFEIDLGVDPELDAEEGAGGDEAVGDAASTEGTEGAEGEDDKSKPDDAPSGDPELDLGDFDPASEEVVAKFDAKYFAPDEGGVPRLNLQAFNPELEANLAAGKADINKGTREYLKASLGLSDTVIDQHIRGVIHEREAARTAVFANFGGTEEGYNAAIEWGKANYTEAQRARFNAAMQKGGEDFAEQLELLKVRMGGGSKEPPATTEGEKAEDKTPARLGPPGKRSASPQRDVTKNAVEGGKGGPAIEPFATREDHTKAQNEAIKSGKPEEIEKVRKRLRASKWFQQGQY